MAYLKLQSRPIRGFAFVVFVALIWTVVSILERPVLGFRRRPELPLPWAAPLAFVHNLSLKTIDNHTIPGRLGEFPTRVWGASLGSLVDLGPERRQDVASWRLQNPFFDHKIFVDCDANHFVSQRFGDWPAVIDVYYALQPTILKADLLRYLILLVEGGIWSDLDVTCATSVENWLPWHYWAPPTKVHPSVVVGLEFDMDWKGHADVASQFASWTIMATPGSKNLIRVVEAVLRELMLIATSNKVSIEGINLGMVSDVVDVTGPKKLTRARCDSLSEDLGRPIGDRDLAHARKPVVISDVVVMPGNAFAARQNGFPDDQGPILVHHGYAGSWKDEAKSLKESWAQLQERASNKHGNGQ